MTVIARDAVASDHLVYAWPFPIGPDCEVACSDDEQVVMCPAWLVGDRLGPGRHLWRTPDPSRPVSAYFVLLAPVEVSFDMSTIFLIPNTGQPVRLRAVGSLQVRCADPALLIAQFVGLPFDGVNDGILRSVSRSVERMLARLLTRRVIMHSTPLVVTDPSMLPQIMEELVAYNPTAGAVFGIELIRLGHLTIVADDGQTPELQIPRSNGYGGYGGYGSPNGETQRPAQRTTAPPPIAPTERTLAELDLGALVRAADEQPVQAPVPAPPEPPPFVSPRQTMQLQPPPPVQEPLRETVRGHASVKDPGPLPRRTRATEPPPPPIPPKRTVSQPPAVQPPAAPPPVAPGPPQSAVSGEIGSNKRAEIKLEQLLTSRSTPPSTTVPSMAVPMPPQTRSPVTLPPPLPKVPMPAPAAVHSSPSATLPQPVPAAAPRPASPPTVEVSNLDEATQPGIDPVKTPIPGSIPPLKSRAAKAAEPAAPESRGQIMGIGMSQIGAGSVAGEIPTKVPPGGRVLVPGPNGLMQSATVRQLLSGYYELEVGSSGETIWVPIGGVVPE